MRKLKLLLVLLVWSRASALLHPGDDWDFWERGRRQQTVSAGGDFSQKRSVVPPGRTLSSSFSLGGGTVKGNCELLAGASAVQHTSVYLSECELVAGKHRNTQKLKLKSKHHTSIYWSSTHVFMSQRPRWLEVRPSAQTAYLIRLSTCFSYTIKRLFPVINPSIEPSRLTARV